MELQLLRDGKEVEFIEAVDSKFLNGVVLATFANFLTVYDDEGQYTPAAKSIIDHVIHPIIKITIKEEDQSLYELMPKGELGLVAYETLKESEIGRELIEEEEQGPEYFNVTVMYSYELDGEEQIILQHLGVRDLMLQESYEFYKYVSEKYDV